ncbi:hypothetical protein [Demequina salsinemoris]|uniref:hypothetical protein n=1 Tax=Demequina salsinemoris TaxID=577470 RepID=UPI00128D4460|nr:hypothetical protein [Demequina salsinemoris]
MWLKIILVIAALCLVPEGSPYGKWLPLPKRMERGATDVLLTRIGMQDTRVLQIVRKCGGEVESLDELHQEFKRNSELLVASGISDAEAQRCLASLQQAGASARICATAPIPTA